ncbi:T-cell surface glycoprotein CD3 zeta chain [Megalops cyprinoides]|uniref:T-cell surface glycoprotein CD3 zeta chain n=1 Tax=Megalops cyprinoides TaxID=118141 RepID=UPI001864240F|nr:T-cell surface glycoprotein CD3 zeta chain [Megalops cyprinoides]
MGLQRTGVLVLLASAVTSAEASGIGDPKYCYALDAVLLLYCVIITALYFREKLSKPKASPELDATYMGLNKSGDAYEPLRHRNDAERGDSAAYRRQADDVYTPLQKPNKDTYNQIAVKRERRGKNEQMYEGLRSGTKDTYDSLQMQPLPPR